MMKGGDVSEENTQNEEEMKILESFSQEGKHKPAMIVLSNQKLERADT